MVSFFRGTSTEFAVVSNTTWCNSLRRPECSAVVGEHWLFFCVTGTLSQGRFGLLSLGMRLYRSGVEYRGHRAQSLTFLFQSSLSRTFVLWETVIIKEFICLRSKVFADLIWGLAVASTNPLTHTLATERIKKCNRLLYIISANRNSRNSFREDTSHSCHNSNSFLSKEKFDASYVFFFTVKACMYRLD